MADVSPNTLVVENKNREQQNITLLHNIHQKERMHSISKTSSETNTKAAGIMVPVLGPVVLHDNGVIFAAIVFITLATWLPRTPIPVVAPAPIDPLPFP